MYPGLLGFGVREDVPVAIPEERRLASRIGGRGLDAKFRKEIDLDDTLPPKELARKLNLARRLYFTRLAHLSAKARRHQNGRGPIG